MRTITWLLLSYNIAIIQIIAELYQKLYMCNETLTLLYLHVKTKERVNDNKKERSSQLEVYKSVLENLTILIEKLLC